MAKKTTKQPVTKKQTRTELNASKLEFVRNLVNQRAYHGEIKKKFGTEFKCSPRTAEPFIKKAREQIRKEIGEPAETHRENSFAYWSAIIADPSRPDSIRMRAQENLDKIMGTAAPVKVAPTDTAGRDLPQDTGRKLTLRELDVELDKLSEQIQPASVDSD